MKTFKMALTLGAIGFASLVTAQQVIIDGKAVAFDVTPQYVNGVLMVAARDVFDTMGVDMRWRIDRDVIEGMRSGNKLEIWVGSKQARLNDRRYDLEEVPYLYHGRTFIPLKVVADGFGYVISMEGGDYVLRKVKS